MKMLVKFTVAICLLKITVFASNETETVVITQKMAGMDLGTVEEKCPEQIIEDNSISPTFQEFYPKSFEDRVILSDHVMQGLLDSGETDDEGISTRSVVDSLDTLTSIDNLLLNFHCTALNDISFSELTDHIMQGTSLNSHNYIILDISDNNITLRSTSALARWLSNPKVLYVNICGNTHCALKNIKNLCLSLHKHFFGNSLCVKKEIVDYTKKIIFLSKSYIWQAKNKVKTYQKLTEDGLLRSDWDNKHKNYYRIVENKADLSFEESFDYYDEDDL